MGRMLVFLVISLGVLFSMANISINNSNASMVDNSIIQYETVQAKNLAASGINLAIKYLDSDSSWSGKDSIKMNGGECNIVVHNTTSQFFNGPDMGLTNARQILSVATVNDVKDTIRAVIQLPVVATVDSSQSNIPAFLDYAVASGNDLQLNGVDKIIDDNNSQWNANVHTNGSFTMDGNATIKGFLTYYGSTLAHPSSRLNNNIVPNQNPDNLPNYSKMDTMVNIPIFDPDKYKNEATVVYNSNAILSGDQTFGTKENPAIVYIGGDLTLRGGTNITGYGALIVKGNINISGNVTINSGSEDEDVSNLALYTKGNLNMNGSAKVHAQILTGGNADISGGSKIYGNVISHGSVQFNGNATIYYKPPNSNLTTPFWTVSNDSSTEGNGLAYPKVLSYYDNINNGSYNYK